MKEIKEGKAVISVPEGKISRKLPIFYNPIMKLNRDLSILLLKSIKEKKLRIADPLAGSGIRSLRFIKELPKSKIEEIHINDIKQSFPKTLKSHLRKNKVKLSKKIKIHNQDANIFLLTNKVFDYIDIDPFGTPNPFLDSAAKKIKRNGILAITATDTSALCGTYKNACKRKYWAVPLRNHLMHEIGLRILVRKTQLVAAQYEKALIPILSYSKEHYMRVFFRCEKGKKNVDQILSQHNHFENIGPIWTGQLNDTELLKNMTKKAKQEEITKFLTLLKQESKINTVGFYDIHALAKKYKLKVIPRKRDLLLKLHKHKNKASETHFSQSGIKTTLKPSQFLKLIKTTKKKTIRKNKKEIKKNKKISLTSDIKSF